MNSFSVIIVCLFSLYSLNCNCMSHSLFDIQRHISIAFRANKLSSLLPLTLCQPSLSLSALWATWYTPFQTVSLSPGSQSCHFVPSQSVTALTPFFFLLTLQLQLHIPASISISTFLCAVLHSLHSFLVCLFALPFCFSTFAFTLHRFVLGYNLIFHCVFQFTHVWLVWKKRAMLLKQPNDSNWPEHKIAHYCM